MILLYTTHVLMFFFPVCIICIYICTYIIIFIKMSSSCNLFFSTFHWFFGILKYIAKDSNKIKMNRVPPHQPSHSCIPVWMLPFPAPVNNAAVNIFPGLQLTPLSLERTQGSGTAESKLGHTL